MPAGTVQADGPPVSSSGSVPGYCREGSKPAAMPGAFAASSGRQKGGRQKGGQAGGPSAPGQADAVMAFRRSGRPRTGWLEAEDARERDDAPALGAH